MITYGVFEFRRKPALPRLYLEKRGWGGNVHLSMGAGLSLAAMLKAPANIA